MNGPYHPSQSSSLWQDLIGPPCWDDEVASACHWDTIYGHHVFPWGLNSWPHSWGSEPTRGKLSFLLCPRQKDKINSHSSHLAACGLLSGRPLSPQTICGSGNGFWIMPYTKTSYSAVSSNIPKYEVSCPAWQFAQSVFHQPKSQSYCQTFKMLDDVCGFFTPSHSVAYGRWMVETVGEVKFYSGRSWKFPRGTLKSHPLCSPAVTIWKPQGRKIFCKSMLAKINFISQFKETV